MVTVVRRIVSATLVLCLVLSAVADARTPKRTVPQGFIGMNVSDGALSPAFPIDRQMGDMVKAGVESVVAAVSWPGAQPVAGGPISFTDTDRIVLAAARHRLTFVPVVVFAPSWAATLPGRAASPPRPDPYAAFLAALARRYGPGGTLWHRHRDVPAMPIRSWQIWNEPELTLFWAQRVWQQDYVTVLRAAHDALKSVDPKAKVLLAGLVNFSWTDLEALYAAGARGLFDGVALHPYSLQLTNVLAIVENVRAVMNTHGDQKLPIVVTEAGWPPSVGLVRSRFGVEVTPAALPGLIRAALPAYASVRKRLGVTAWYWYAWATADKSTINPFDYSGLRTIVTPATTRDKPPLAAFRTAALRLEGCRSKGSTAVACRR